MPRLPAPRGPISDSIVSTLRGAPPDRDPPIVAVTDPLSDDDLHLALYCLYELHYRGFEEVDERLEWNPALLATRARLEQTFSRALEQRLGVGEPAPAPSRMDIALRTIADADPGPSLSRYLETRGTLEQFREFLVHRSAYQLKEADPHSWAIPRLTGGAKAALVEVQADEYGGGSGERIHAELFAKSMRAAGLDAGYGAYLDLIPGVTLATVNLMSMFGLHRRTRGAIAGHLALFEMTSTTPNRRYGNALRRLGLPPDATDFFDEHVEADAVHENIAAVDLAGGLAAQEPALADQILFGARALVELDGLWARHVLDRWERGVSSLLGSLAPAGRPEAHLAVGSVAERA